MIAPAPPGSGGWVRRLMPYLLAHRRDATIAFGVSVLGVGLVQGATPWVIRHIIDNVLVAHREMLAPWLTVLVVFGVVNFASGYVRRFFGGRVSLDVQYDLRNSIYERLQRLDFASHDDLQTGQLVSRASSDVALIQGLLSFTPVMVGNLVQLVVSFAFMLWFSPPLTLVALAAVPALLVVALRLRSTIFPSSWDNQQWTGEVAGVVDEAVSGVRVVKAFGQEQRELERLTQVSRSLFSSRMRTVRLQARFTPTMAAIPALAQVAVLGFGGWLAIHHRISLGTFLAFSSYMVQLVAPVRMFAAVLAVGQQARAGAQRILDLLDANPLVIEAPTAVALPSVVGEVTFDEVRFGYQRGAPVLDGFTLRVPAGETVALVGASGSGKSTVSLLLPRFYDVESGTVAIDGHDVRDLTLASLRRQVGVVFEESFLFSDTVRSNISYGRPDASPADVEAAARAAEAHDFITALPEGYDTVVGERGMSLSGGQRQRVSLARALLSDPQVLILDDATSSVDSSTEEDIHATLRRVMEGRTTVLIAHRRSTLRLASRIVVVDAGRIVDEGGHEELLERSSLYRDLLGAPDDPSAEQETDGTTTGRSGRPASSVTASAWAPRETDGRRTAAAGTTPQGQAAARTAAGGGPMGGMTLSATPELLAGLARLPAATDQPDVDPIAVARSEDRFTLGGFVRPFRRALIVGLGLVVGDTVLTLAGPLLVRRGLDNGVTRGDEGAVWLAAAAFLAAVLLDWLLTWGYTRYTGRTAERLLFALRVRIFAHLQRLSLDFYDREMAGRVMTRMTTDVEAFSQLLQTGLITAVVSVLTCTGITVLLAVLDWRLALSAGVVLPALVTATVWFRRRSGSAYELARDRIGAVNANLQESLSGVRVAQAYGREDRNIASFQQVAGGYLSARLTAQRLISLYFPFVLLLSDLASAAVLGAGSVLTARHTVTAGVVIAFLLYLDQFFSPIQQLSQVFDTYQQAGASAERLNELMATPVGTPAPPEPFVPSQRLRGAVSLRGVHFAYQGSSEEALSGVDLDVAPGETVALVGETGAGKSTIVKLVARFYDATAGTVAIDGTPVGDYDISALRRQLGVVPQEAFLFSGTIRDNIAYGRPEASDAEVEAAARAVGAHDLVATLTGGYHHHVSERGRSLSAGQRQLIALARAQLVDPVILLLDEATSNLDLASEARVQRAMGVLARGRTTLLVAHRLPTARSADRICVVDRGRIAEMGTHDELVARGGLYTELWSSFAAGERDPEAAA
ncbi:MAG: ABC transporter ATP-binding protein [Acidimicrobiales bacterium]